MIFSLIIRVIKESIFFNVKINLLDKIISGYEAIM
jgi:hypothetical protein